MLPVGLCKVKFNLLYSVDGFVHKMVHPNSKMTGNTLIERVSNINSHVHCATLCFQVSSLMEITIGGDDIHKQPH